MRLPDRVTGSFLVGLGAAAAYGGWLLPPVPGQPVGPNVFPLVIGSGLALCGLAIAFGIGRTFEEEEEIIPIEGGAGQAAARQALRTARPAAAGAAAVLRGGGRPARLHHHGRADRLRRPRPRSARGWKLALPLAVLAPIGIHLIFSKLLRVPLPIGLLPMPW